MAHGKSDPNEKIVYVGDSRVKQRSTPLKQPDYTAFPGKSEAFIPNFLLKEWMVGCVALVGFLVLTIAHPAPLGYPADANNTSFLAIPDWYFLFLYQLLKYPFASGDYIIMGTMLMPGLAFGGLLLAPFLDTGKERRFYRRPIATASLLLTLVAITYLTRVSWIHYEDEMKAKGLTPQHIERVEKMKEKAAKGLPTGQEKKNKEVAIVEKDDPAMENMKKATCLSCHGVDMKGGAAPALRGIGDKMSKEEILDVMKNGKGNMPAMGDSMKQKGLSDQDVENIADWLAKQKAQ
ncbi:menaquinol-cytochrome c reductase cytochrome b/c subunit [Paenibacillus sp. 481]|uniref:menaquinol-cytochrome c reductase cytochrome b/c subunit n=1 Tax=Paenibacillus sp. 481 TaxID=2835869 RepID=UPI001E3BA1E1|nr:menaquinol-cytochrome c reductase cytochrome b/c subunit [Paenibacillus sp. 481]UHA72984.1 c-type cytochrome [Paenibacillus sp. 481]